MKILLYGLNFAPEQTGIGKYTGEMATWLSDAGHEVRVVTAPPYYPQWAVGAGYSAWGGVVENHGDVKVWRTPVWVPAKPTGLARIVHLASFAVMSLPTMLKQVWWKPDAVVVVAPAFACAPGGWLTARLSGAKAWLHIQDFEIDAAFRMGLLKGRLVRRALCYAEGWMLRRFDRVSTISQRMMDLLYAKNVTSARVVSFPNWVDVNAITPSKSPSPYRDELGIAKDAVVALYSGSMAGKQGLELIPASARALEAQIPNLVFVICGEGVAKPGLARDCAGLSNVRMLPLQPAARLGELLGMADIHLLPQHSEAADLVMPSKLTGMLSSGRPVLATANAGTEIARVVTGLGLVVPPGDVVAFNAALSQLAESAELRARFGADARQYAEDRLSQGRVLVDFEQALRNCVEKKPVAPDSDVANVSSTARETAKPV